MQKRNLNQIHSLAVYPMARVKSSVMAQAWFLSTKCRPATTGEPRLVIQAGRHTVRGCGLLRTLKEDRA